MRSNKAKSGIGFCVLVSLFLVTFSLLLSVGLVHVQGVAESAPAEWTAKPMYYVFSSADPQAITGFSPTQIKAAYNLPSSGGGGTTIAIVTAYNASNIRSDLTVFCQQFSLPQADLEIYNMSTRITVDNGWSTETSLDVEWSHAIAPEAHILLVQARSANNNDLIAAIDYARGRSDVVALSMSWGGSEFSGETTLDTHFISNYNAAFFAASGDDGAGAIWPAASPRVVAVGGTVLRLNAGGGVLSETGWSGSGGGASNYEAVPSYQTQFGLQGTKRTTPDVSYNAGAGVAVYCNGAWSSVGGTSAGSPQWAAIYALGLSATHQNLYQDAAADYAAYFRDITSGSNGYSATTGYDLVTGLGSPLTVDFTPSISGTTNTTVNLHPTGQSTPLSAENRFTATYTVNGEQQTAQLQDSLIIETDKNTVVTLSGASTGSTATERWVFNSAASAVTLTAGSTTTLYYFNLLTQTTSYNLTAAGKPEPPTLSYSTAPATASSQPAQQQTTLQLSQANPQTVWAIRGSTATVTNPLAATVTEQWTTDPSSWLLTGANQLPAEILYTQQFLLKVTGAQSASSWYDSGSTVQVDISGVLNRIQGAGQRVTSYSVDGETTALQPAAETLQIPIVMNQSHTVTLTTVNQYQVTLDESATTMLASATPPTIAGDNYWYDEGTPVRIVLNGLGARTGGAGNRLSSYAVNGELTTASTTGTVEALNVDALHSPQTLTATIAQQFQLNTETGSVVSMTSPPIAGDQGWYDAGTPVTVTYAYSWSQTAGQSRLNAVSYQIGNGETTTLTRAAEATFQVQVNMNQPQTIHVASTWQFSFQLSGGHNTVLSQISPTSDAFFDNGTSLTATTDRMWDLQNGNTRQTALSYTLDDTTVPIPATEAATFTTPVMTINEPHILAFNTDTQYLVTFEFKDNTGSQTIEPSTFEIETAETGTVSVSQSHTAWLNNETQFQVRSVIWQGADVKPTDQTVYKVNAALNVTLLCRVFNATITVQNSAGTPVSGAQVTVTLANQTAVEAVTGNDGTVNLPLIPLGTYAANVTYEGKTTSFAGDASTQAVLVITLQPPPTPTPTAEPTGAPASPAASSEGSPEPSTTPSIPEFPWTYAFAALVVASLVVITVLRLKRMSRKPTFSLSFGSAVVS